MYKSPDAQPAPGTRQIVAGNGMPKAKLRPFLASQKNDAFPSPLKKMKGSLLLLYRFDKDTAMIPSIDYTE
ncbi:MAG TPA: hypothetical protein VHD63_08240, partial [Ktedonobacteraceae bacterium]|nr:hypothetical protein [Ktedonobacteraceae bacterium]